MGWIREVVLNCNDFYLTRAECYVTLHRSGGLPGPAVHGFCASAGGSAAGVCAGGADTGALPVRPPRPTHR